jgi:hypothetical protein
VRTGPSAACRRSRRAWTDRTSSAL